MKSVSLWHSAVNGPDLPLARSVVADPIVVNGPRGAGALSPAEFAEWVTRSGISLRPLATHPVGDRLLVVEQDARWPTGPSWTRVATVFRLTPDGSRVSAALRFPSLPEALAFAELHAALCATDPS